MKGAGTSEEIGGQRLPLDASSEDIHDAGEDLPRRQWLAACSWFANIFPVLIALWRRNQRLNTLPQRLGDFPRWRDVFSFHLGIISEAGDCCQSLFRDILLGVSNLDLTGEIEISHS